MTDNRLPNLTELDDWELVNSDQDLRGCPLRTRSGETVGTVRRMLVDRDRERVAALVLDNGRTVPVEDVEIREGQVLIDEARDLPAGAAARPERAASAGNEEVIPIVEEELRVGKRSVERGHIQVRSRIVEAPVHEQVTLRDEHVEVERRPVDDAVRGRDADRLFEGRTVEVTETDEEAVVAKDARVVEEVVVRKDADQRVERIDDTVRQTQVDVDRIEGDDRSGTKGTATG